MKKIINALIHYHQYTNEIVNSFINTIPVYYHCFENKQKNHQRTNEIEKSFINTLLHHNQFANEKSFINALLLYYRQRTNEIVNSLLSLF